MNKSDVLNCHYNYIRLWDEAGKIGEYIVREREGLRAGDICRKDLDLKLPVNPTDDSEVCGEFWRNDLTFKFPFKYLYNPNWREQYEKDREEEARLIEESIKKAKERKAKQAEEYERSMLKKLKEKYGPT